MRVIGGRAGGRRLSSAPDGTRPTTDRVREALFSSLGSMVGEWSTVRALDLFAGSGAVGLEALSRGARSATFVENDRRCLEVLRRNAAAVDPSATIVAADVLRWVPEDGPYDLAYVDPPYALDESDLHRVLETLALDGVLAPEALVVIERSSRSPEPWPAAGWEGLRRRDYGETSLWYGRRVSEESTPETRTEA